MLLAGLIVVADGVGAGILEARFAIEKVLPVAEALPFITKELLVPVYGTTDVGGCAIGIRVDDIGNREDVESMILGCCA